MSAYTDQLRQKTDYLTKLLQSFHLPSMQVFPSAEQHFRQRAEFRVWHEGDEMCYAMFQKGQKASSNSLIKIEKFPIAAQSINDIMPRLMAAMAAQNVLRHRWYQVEFLATLSGEMLITLIYHKRLDEEWEVAARALQTQLGVWIIGRSRGQKIVLQQDFVTEKLTVHGQNFIYRQIEGGFTQPNARMCEKMLEWACTAAGDSQDFDLLELYCGNGNFTLPLSQHFRRVLATEVSKTSVQAAQWNIAANHRDNIEIARLSAEEFTQAFSGCREFERLRTQGVSLQDYDFSTIFIDPPRAGVDDETLQLVAQFERVIYVSCNPETLRDNLAVLTKTHDIQQLALFDQFPFTHHIESGVLLVKKSFQAA
ncbi:tRNA (uridine(54)-C5)-methyltransferase TrmA [Alysiella crassa]|uniref:tRNA/tmRNA (uracil-C(5))-methyltransferase n=1 Tax=Alysiella crassa TaxID=153491 RepID=A0A376BTT2_9NEIS|nr:tRNA (uridine(54)-C5)-methyltransferase TrmA [Alysiella crassa]UOP05827.1 tRNA (uridine(54)-C5)-methyltransferase TrmA [Alysiella crassa]SSY80248.1 tRNA (uracil(54)-C(5))-methyltransferase [Alysiella crassa]